MADPVGLVSLGLSGVGKAVTTARSRKRHRKIVKALAEQTEAADLKLRNAGADVEAYRTVLSPLLEEAITLLQRVSARKRFQVLGDAIEDTPEDIETATKPIDAFKAADAAIELLCNLWRIDSRVSGGNEATLVTIHNLQRDVARLEKTVKMCMVLGLFYIDAGIPGETCQVLRKLRASPVRLYSRGTDG